MNKPIGLFCQNGSVCRAISNESIMNCKDNKVVNNLNPVCTAPHANEWFGQLKCRFQCLQESESQKLWLGQPKVVLQKRVQQH